MMTQILSCCCRQSLYHLPLFLGLFLLFSAILSGVLFMSAKRVNLERDIARRRSLSNADRAGEKIKFYIDEDEVDHCGDDAVTTVRTTRDLHEAWQVEDMV